ncbi:hypothetical protein [Leucobacter chromiireducens]|uniref:hypothetical protein n=1 Tax=Leucobacter chromiireducens TaxID=283877 RepID=UPI001F1DFD27|nr:hypothetical protein [Leucobacter chromiireducens]
MTETTQPSLGISEHGSSSPVGPWSARAMASVLPSHNPASPSGVCTLMRVERPLPAL